MIGKEVLINPNRNYSMNSIVKGSLVKEDYIDQLIILFYPFCSFAPFELVVMQLFIASISFTKDETVSNSYAIAI